VILTPHNIVYYLLDRNLLTPESVVDGDFMVVEHSSRNRNFKVIRRENTGYFVKQVRDPVPDAIATLRTEATCYWLAQNDPAFSALSPLLPHFYGYDPQRHVVVTELLSPGESLGEYHRRFSTFPPEMAAQLGKALGSYHREVRPPGADSPHSTTFRRVPPWILAARQYAAGLQGTGANTQVLAIISQYSEFQQVLDTLQREWQPTALIHGDIKFENCMVATGPEGEVSIKVVDWEIADIGDPYWDVGAVFQSYLSFWIFSVPVTTQMPISEALELAHYPLENMQPAMQAFWKSYLETREVAGKEAGPLLRRCVQYGAARMLQTAYEYMNFASQISMNTICLLQVSLNILEGPDEAIEHLLGIEV
jgi:hypothetical protein